MVPEASNTFKLMFLDALEVQESSQIDPGLIWGNSFFHENIHQKYPSSNERLDFEISSFSGAQLFKMSQFLKPKPSPTLTMYYSYLQRAVNRQPGYRAEDS